MRTDVYVSRYGMQFSEQPSILEEELAAFLDDPPASIGGLGRAEHFWNICAILWGPKSTKPFLRNPWAERMAAAASKEKYLGLNGCANSGKSDFGAVWGIVNWLAAPKDTLVMATSTSLKESGKRIWGSVKAYYTAAGLEGVGKLVESLHAIRTVDGSGVFNDKDGVYCIAADKKDEKDAIAKLIGAKNKRVILIADELPELTEAILTAAYSNLAMNETDEPGTMFQLIGIGNFKGIYDPFGVFVRPKAGYGSISVDMDEWETERGTCLHFDGMRSPNILSGENLWGRIYGSKNLANHRKDCGPDSAEFWRMCRSFPTPIGLENVIYSESDLLNGKAAETECLWMRPPVKVSSLDPSFTNGGDRSCQIIGSYGECVDGIWRIRAERVLMLKDDVNDRTPRDYQIARKFRDNCIAEGIIPKNSALDTSGAGSVLWSICAEEWSHDVLMVNFSGSASETYVRANDTNTAKMQFDRRVSELWWVGREFMKYGQIRGVTPDLARELCARHYDTVKGTEGLKVSVEKKSDMKKRLGFSPDLADSFAVLLELCRQRFNFLAGGVASGQNVERLSWEKEVETANNLYANVDYSESGDSELAASCVVEG